VADHLQRIRALVGSHELLQVPSVSIALRDGEGRVLLARHAEHGAWLLPGGAIEPGETPVDAAVREMHEETGLAVRVTRLVGVFGGPDFVVDYKNGDRTSYVMAVYEAVAGDGRTPAPDERELLELRWVLPHEATTMTLARWVPTVLHAVFAEPGES